MKRRGSTRAARVAWQNEVRSAKGGLFVLILASILIIVVVGICFGWFMFLSGGFRESQHAVDAGSLNLAKHVVINPATELSSAHPESAFHQVAENRDGKYFANLNNINRLSAELFLIDANCAAMKEENSGNQYVATASEPMHRALSDIQGRLAEQLAARANVIPYYEVTANENSIRMLKTCSNNDIRVYQTDYRIGYTDRGELANVYMNDNQIPKGFRSKWESGRSNWTSEISEGAFAGKRYYLRGYTNEINPLGSKPIYFVTLKEGHSVNEVSRCQPHLISESTMKRDKDAGGLAWSKPVPNAFGITMNTGTKYIDPLSTTASSSVVRSMRPTEGFYAQIPHGFIRIRNAPPQKVECGVDTPHNDDVFNFIKNTPVDYAEGPPKRHYEKDGEKFIDNILKAIKSGKLPKEADMKALKKPAEMQEAKDFNKKSDKIDNHTYKTFLPLIPSEIGEAYGKHVPREASKQSDQLHCYEAACFALLAARSIGDNGDPFSLKAGASGIAHFELQRTALAPSQKQFTKTMTLEEIFKDPNSHVVERLKQRCYEIFPAFSGDVKDIVGWNSEKIPMGATLYIYWDGTINQETGHPEGKLRVASVDNLGKAPWVTSHQNAVPEGKPAALDCDIKQISPKGGGGLDLKGDWSYEEPFDTYKGDQKLVVRNLAAWTPASGVEGLLGEIDLAAQFGATTKDALGVEPGFSTHDISEKGALAPCPLEVKGTYSGPG